MSQLNYKKSVSSKINLDVFLKMDLDSYTLKMGPLDPCNLL